VKAGTNNVKLIFQSPVNYQKTRIKDSDVTLPAPNDLGKIAVAPYCRKPQYQFGWDWSLRMTTIGMWNPVSVKAYDRNRMINKSVYTATLAEDFALMELQLVLRNRTTDTLVWESKLFGTAKVVAENGPAGGETLLKRLERIDDPELWWPRGHGAQHLYEDEWTLKTLSGTVIGTSSQRFGVRRSELIMQPDRWGTSYTIRLNGRDLFCKGADYIPQDIFPARVTDAALRETVRTMKAANFNMVRVWGGGYYQPEAFYDACDEQGIMVWQDFMFACAMYPGTDAFLANVKREFDQQIPRLSAHPSVVIFNGNNEVDVAWKNWGFREQYRLDERQSALIQKYYDRLFLDLLPKTVKSWTNVPYIHTSPLSNWGKDEFFDHGTMHYWGVWHGKDPIEDFGRKTGRFNAEYGFQSFPEYSTLLKFSDPLQWKLDDAVMKHHQKSYVGNGMIEKHATILYGKTDDFKRFVYFSQLTQATAVSMAVSSHRTNMPRCSGTIYWQMNDCWPAPTWSSIDYYGNWKALQYLVREDYEDIAIVAKVDTIGAEQYYLVSDIPDGFGCRITCDIYALDGEKKASWTCNRAVNGFHSSELFRSEFRRIRPENFMARFSWNDGQGKQHERSFVHLAESAVSATPEELSWTIGQVDTVAKTAVIVIRNKKFVRQCWVSCQQQGVRFSRNFLDLLPGEHAITISYDVLPTKADFELIWL
jgi:beta-mannosidase